MINTEGNPEFLNSFLDYTTTILNKSPNTIKEYNYDNIAPPPHVSLIDF